MMETIIAELREMLLHVQDQLEDTNWHNEYGEYADTHYMTGRQDALLDALEIVYAEQHKQENK